MSSEVLSNIREVQVDVKKVEFWFIVTFNVP